MNKTTTLTILSAALLATPLAEAGTWSIDGSHSQVGFAVSHMMVSKTRGHFKGVQGAIDLNDKDLTKSKISVEIDPNTVDTDDAKRDGHLKSPDFFDTKKHPKITFVSKRIMKAGKKYKVHGDLTIRGVSKPVVLDADITPARKSPWGQNVRGVSASTTINRKDFGISWNKALDAGGVVVGNEVDINIDVELVSKS